MFRFSALGMGIVLLMSMSSTAKTETKVIQRICDMFAEENKLYLEDGFHKLNTDMTEERFNEIIDSVVQYYTPLAESHGATLNLERNWEDSTVNAYASRPSPNVWNVAMFGGLARRPEVTDDGFALVLCHELGHQFGGYPFARLDWAANEGQSDYFATQACARKVWKDQKEQNALAANNASTEIKSYCDKAWSTEEDRNLCYRIGAGSQSLANLLAKLRNSATVPNAETPDPNHVDTTSSLHPEPQCRLDTYLAGAVCDKNFDDSLIPGLVDGSGTRTRPSEAEAATVSCMRSQGYASGVRPRCWFAALMSLKIQSNDRVLTEISGNQNGVLEPGETYALTIPVNNTFLNDIEDVKGKLSSETQGVAVERDTANYNTVSSDSNAVPENAVEFSLADDFACGAKVDLTYGIQSAHLSDQTILNLTTGVPVAHNTLTSDLPEPVEIPDNVDTGVDFSLEQGSQDKMLEVQVHVKLTHRYVSDVQITLEEPNGQKHVIKKKYEDRGVDLDKTYSIVPTGADTSGVWKINIADVARSDVGTVDALSMSFMKAKCEP